MFYEWLLWNDFTLLTVENLYTSKMMRASYLYREYGEKPAEI